jgi:hypothetical protein
MFDTLSASYTMQSQRKTHRDVLGGPQQQPDERAAIELF